MNIKILRSISFKILFIVLFLVSVSSAFFAGVYSLRYLDNILCKQEPAEFSKMVADLKQQAHNASLIPAYPEIREAVEAVGESLKNILTSEYSEFISNETFNSEEFSVLISTHTLKNGEVIKKISYSLNDILENKFFLQYIGGNSFFSSTFNKNFDDKDFYVFKNKEGVFAISIRNYYDFETFASPEKIKDYNADVYYLDGGGFSVQSYVEIPFSVGYDEDIRMVQQGEIIKAVVYNEDNNLTGAVPECLFNGKKIIFEVPEINFTSEPVDYELPGLLLGMSDTKGNLRTLYIRKEDGRILCDEYANQIIFPRKNKLYSLKNYVLNEDLEGYSDYGEQYRVGSINFKKILSGPLGADLTADFQKIFFPKPEYSFYDLIDIPLYVGEDYVCYIQKGFFTGGGTFHVSNADIRFDKLDNLSKFKAEYEYDCDVLTPKFKETTLSDFIYGAKTKEFYQEEIRIYGGILNPYFDFKQLSIKRNLGRWSLMLPVMEDYYHPGNGSNGKVINTFAVFSNNVPSNLASNREAMDVIHERNWYAKDMLRIPESNAVLYQYDYYIGLENQIEGSEVVIDKNFKIPVGIDEYIVSINFADEATQEVWLDELAGELKLMGYSAGANHGDIKRLLSN